MLKILKNNLIRVWSSRVNDMDLTQVVFKIITWAHVTYFVIHLRLRAFVIWIKWWDLSQSLLSPVFLPLYIEVLKDMLMFVSPRINLRYHDVLSYWRENVRRTLGTLDSHHVSRGYMLVNFLHLGDVRNIEYLTIYVSSLVVALHWNLYVAVL